MSTITLTRRGGVADGPQKKHPSLTSVAIREKDIRRQSCNSLTFVEQRFSISSSSSLSASSSFSSVSSSSSLASSFLSSATSSELAANSSDCIAHSMGPNRDRVRGAGDEDEFITLLDMLRDAPPSDAKAVQAAAPQGSRELDGRGVVVPKLHKSRSGLIRFLSRGNGEAKGQDGCNSAVRATRSTSNLSAPRESTESAVALEQGIERIRRQPDFDTVLKHGFFSRHSGGDPASCPQPTKPTIKISLTPQVARTPPPPTAATQADPYPHSIRSLSRLL